jgi:transglutaminase-like putative cysteine protease
VERGDGALAASVVDRGGGAVVSDRRPTARATWWLGPLPEVSLALVTIAAVLGLDRIFADRSYFGPVVLAAITSHALAWTLRRRGVNAGLSAVISLAAAVLFCAWVIEPSTTAYGVPGGGFWHAAVDDLRHAWAQYDKVSAPVVPERGFVLASAIGAWWTAFVADWAAFRLNAAFESLVPGFTLFTFAAALGSGEGRITASALFLGAVLFFLLVHGATQRSGRTAWFASRIHGGPEAIIRSGALIGAATVIVALVVGPAIPGASDEAMIAWRKRDRNPNPSRVTVSPLVDVRGRLVQQSDVEVFTVESKVRSYWRLTSLDTFDGSVWGSRGSYKKAGDRLKQVDRVQADVTEGVQRFTIEALDTPWLPAAFRADRYSGPVGVTYDAESSSLLTEADTGAGLVYDVQSALPKFTPQELSAAPTAVPNDVESRYTELPANFPASVARLAQQVTGGARTTYDRALALQEWFRTNFTYTLDVPRGHDDNAMLRFLFQDRRGYCEQFAGSFAAMARTLGIPARVAVGFTPGEVQDDGLYHVTGRQAHAWPEVYVPNYGWVAFEPTPGRGIPGGESYTRVPDQQDLSTGPVVLPDPSAETTIPNAAATPNTTPNPNLRDPGDDSVLSGTPFGDASHGSPWPRRLLVLAIALGALAVLWLVAVPIAGIWLRRRRRARAVTPSARTLVAWEEAADTLALVGAARVASETNDEFARRAVTVADVEPSLVDPLAQVATIAAFAPQGVGDDDADQAVALSGELQTAVRERAGTMRRLRWVLDPRTLRRR